MDPNYAMAKFGLESKGSLMSKHRGCWHYTKYFFLFSSIIQFLIILGLVLFLLYGNAHVSTEVRLKNLENRYRDLLDDYSLVSKNFDQLKPKAASLENVNANCSNLLNTAHRELYNKNRNTSIGRPVSTSCESTIQKTIDQCNTTYIIETLQLKHDKLILQRDYDKLKEKCEQTSGFLTNKFDVTANEVEKLQEGKDDLETKIKILQNVCTNINGRFQTELERMKSRFEGIISAPEHSQYSKCRSINNDINNNVDLSIKWLKDDVKNVMFENSQLKTDNARVADNFQKCSEENIIIISEKNHLSIEKGGLEKQLLEKKEELSKSITMYTIKEEELQNCRKMQPGGRTPGVFIPRT